MDMKDALSFELVFNIILLPTLIAFDQTQDQPEESSVPDPVVDGRVDWSQTFAGTEQPNEAYSLVMKKNKVYEKINKRSRQKRQLVNQQPQHLAISELGSRERDTEGPHEYEDIDVLPPSDVLKQNQETVNEQMDGRVDWSQTFAGIEQPNEAYSLVMKKNKAYERVKKQSQQERPHHPVTSQMVLPVRGVTELEGPHEYEEIVPRDGVSVAT